MSEKGLSCMPVDKGEFFNHPDLGCSPERSISRARSAGRLSRRAAFLSSTGPAALPIEAIAASVLEEILPISPHAKQSLMMSSCSGWGSSWGGSPKSSSGMAAFASGMGALDSLSASPSFHLASALLPSPTAGKTPKMSMSMSMGLVATTGAAPTAAAPGASSSSRFELLRTFRAAILAKFSTVVQAYKLFSRDTDPERDLNKAEWRNLLSRHGFPEFAGRKEINSLFGELDFSGDNQVSLKEWYIALEMAAPVRTLEALRRRWISTGFKSMTQAIRAMDKDDNVVGSRRLDFDDFGKMLSQTQVDEEPDHRALFNAVCGDSQPTTSIEELHSAVAAVSPSLMLEDLRDKLSKRFKGDLERAFSYLDKDNGGSLDMKEFVNMAMRKFEMTQMEAEKVFREIDLDGGGDITTDEFLSAMAIAEPSLFLEELRLKVRQRYHSIRQALNKAFADEVTDGLESDAMLSKAKFTEALIPLGFMEPEIVQLFDLIDNNGDGELSAQEFMKGVQRFAPACVLEDLRVRCCQEYGHIREAFANIPMKTWAKQLDRQGFSKRLIGMRLLPSSGSDDLDVQAVFDLLDVNHEGSVTIGKLAAALCCCGAGSRAKLPDEERDYQAWQTVQGDVANLQRSLWDFRKEVRAGKEAEVPLPAPLAGPMTEKLGESMKTKSKSGPEKEQAAMPSPVRDDKVTAAASDGVPPRLKTATQDDIPKFLKAVPSLAADCTCAAEVAVFDTKDSFEKMWGRMHESPQHLQPGPAIRKDIHNYYQSVVLKLSQDAPLHHKVESRLATYHSKRIAQGGLRPSSQGGPRPGTAAAAKK